LKLNLHNLLKIKIKRSHKIVEIKAFLSISYLMIEGSGSGAGARSGSIPLTNGSVDPDPDPGGFRNTGKEAHAAPPPPPLAQRET
jgi:hypothetical protein